MRNLILLAAFLIGSIISGFAANYKETMIQTIEKLNKSQDANELVEIANTFDRIAQKESTEWLPLYYSAYATIVFTTFFNQKPCQTKKRSRCLKSTAKTRSGKSGDNEDEIMCQAMILSA